MALSEKELLENNKYSRVVLGWASAGVVSFIAVLNSLWFVMPATMSKADPAGVVVGLTAVAVLSLGLLMGNVAALSQSIKRSENAPLPCAIKTGPPSPSVTVPVLCSVHWNLEHGRLLQVQEAKELVFQDGKLIEVK